MSSGYLMSRSSEAVRKRDEDALVIGRVVVRDLRLGLQQADDLELQCR